MKHLHEHCRCHRHGHRKLNEAMIMSTTKKVELEDQGMKRCPLCGNEDIEERETYLNEGIMYDLGQTMYCPECKREWTSWWRIEYDTSNIKNRYKHGNKKWSYRPLTDREADLGACPYCHGLDIGEEGISTDHVHKVVQTMTCADCGGVWDDIYTITGYVDTRIDDPEGDKARYNHDRYCRSVNKYYGQKRLKPDEKEELAEIDRLYKKYGGGLEIPGYC